MTQYLFIGGSAHGSVRDIKLTIFEQYKVPKINKPAVAASEWIQDPVGIIDFEVETYRLKRPRLSSGEFAEVMVEESLTLNEVFSKLGDYLTEQWIKEQHKANLAKQYMGDISPISFKEIESFVQEMKKTKGGTPDKILDTHIPGIDRVVAHFCPVCKNTQERAIKGWVVHFNDKHKWTFDQIADYVDEHFRLTVKE